MNSILMQVFLLSRWEKAVWTAIEIVSSVDLLGWYANWNWVQGFWDDGVDVSHDQPFQAFHGNRCKCYGAVVI
jgi:hypothetical protein